jgi:hypothetical protein
MTSDSRGLDDFLADNAQSVDLQYAGDLGEESLDEPEIPAGDAVDGCDGLGVGVQRHEFLAGDARCHAEGRRVEQRVEVIAIPDLGVAVAPVVEDRLEFVPVGVLPGREGLADTRRAVAQADVAVVPAGIGKLSDRDRVIQRLITRSGGSLC